MKIVVPNQTGPDEGRVAIDPAVTKKLIGLGLNVVVESGAGQPAQFADAAFTEAGAAIASGDAFASAWAEADIVLTLVAPTSEQAGRLKAGAVLVGMLTPLANVQLIAQLAQAGVTSFSMEFIPRISRAQPMDVLSSQANLAGYIAVIIAARTCPKVFPMMMTAAGTIAPSRVFILGAGVAGLQAIATAKRLGSIVEAYDVRPEVEEQVQSLGGRFVKLPTTRKEAGAAGGYAREQTDEDRRKQVELMTKHVVAADAVISTAAVFGKAPPMLIPADMVRQMRTGSVIVDIAADRRAKRGNCELTRPGETYTTDNGVIIDGTINLPRLVPVHASQMYANNMLAFLKEIIKDGGLKFDFEDEIQKGACMSHDGQVRNEMVRKAMEPNK